MSKHCKVREKYLSVYKAAFTEVIEALVSANRVKEGSLKLTTIDELTIQAWKKEWLTQSPRHKHGEWDWKKMVTKRIKRCKKFDLAIWGEGMLCGLTLGMVTKGSKTVRMDYLQACPSSHPLESKITEIAVSVAIAVGQRVGASHIAIFNPINETVERHYMNLGFQKKRIYGNFIKNALYLDVPSVD
ncbi:MAG: hypothetical protein ACRC6N_11220 [Plesiomonas sp.]|uniref:hypothetical protein n=1 Tax=Plesiomonas sp. TaxID=2486279 RepID=UPI003F3B0F78